MKEAILKIEGLDLCSRTKASEYRGLLFELINKYDSVDVDIRGVLSMSDGFADELFAVTACYMGYEEFFKKVHILFPEGAKNRSYQIASVLNVRKKGLVNPN